MRHESWIESIREYTRESRNHFSLERENTKSLKYYNQYSKNRKFISSNFFWTSLYPFNPSVQSGIYWSV